MDPFPSPAGPLPLRVHQVGETIVTAGLAATLAGTVLSLGGYLAGTMVFVVCAISAVAVLGTMVWALGRAGESRCFNWAVLLPLPFLLYALVSSIGRAPAGWLAWREWLLWWQAWLAFAVTLHVGRGRAHTWVLVGAMAALGLVGFGLAAYQRAADPAWLPLGRTLAQQFRGRSSGMFGIPNSLAAFIELLVPACLGLLFSTTVRSAVKVVAGWLAALLLAALVLTGSRGGWLALGLALLVWALAGGGDWIRRVRRLAMVGVALGVALWGIYRGSDAARERLEPLIEGRLEISRPIMWRAAFSLWNEAPWWGQGGGAFNVLFDRHRPERFGDEPVWVHNDYLNTLCDHGILGFALWFTAGATLFVLGWRAARQARRRQSAADIPFGLGKWKMGLWAGLLAFALHLAVDFHTKIPGLALAAAVAAGLMLRDDDRLRVAVGRVSAWLGAIVLASATLGLAWWVALPHYRAEARRFEAREAIDRYALRPTGNLVDVVRAARPLLTSAVRIDPTNGRAWSDLAYVTALGGSAGLIDRAGAGRFAELAADAAIRLSPLSAEFWVRKGVALDLQGGRADAEACYKEATKLAPKTAAWWFYYCRHLQRFAERNEDARKAIETCLALDPYYAGAESLRQQLVNRR